MSKLIDLFSPYSPNGLLSIETPGPKISDWINEGDFEPDSPIVNPNQFTLKNYSKSIMPTFSAEIERMLCATAESYSGITATSLNKKAIGWALIKAYYASYFAAHAILRMHGRCCSQLEAKNTQVIHSVITSLRSPNSAKPNVGQYAILYSQAQQTISFTGAPTKRGGSHQFMWNYFSSFLEEITRSPLARSTIYQSEITRLDNLIDILKCNDGWLSLIRNNINYRLMYSVWYPYAGVTTQYSEKILKGLKISARPMEIDFDASNINELIKFSKVVTFILSLANELANDLIQKSSCRRSFLSKNYRKIQKQLSIPY